MTNDRIHLLFFFPNYPELSIWCWGLSQKSGNKDQKIKSRKNKYEAGKTLDRKWDDWTTNLLSIMKSFRKKPKKLYVEKSQNAPFPQPSAIRIDCPAVLLWKVRKTTTQTGPVKRKKSLDKPEILFHTSLTTGVFCSTIPFIKVVSRDKPKL